MNIRDKMRERVDNLFYRYPAPKVLCATVLFVFLSGCANAVEQPFARPAPGGTGKRVFVVNYGWHTGIAISKADIPRGLLPEAEDLPGETLELGWGDRDFYQTTDAGIGLAIKAAFSSGGSVVHVTAFNGAVGEYFRGAEIYELTLSAEGYLRLTQFVSDSFLRPETTNESLQGLFPNSRFYPARGKFHLLRNCNTWVAEALAAAGLSVNPSTVITAGNLFSQVKRLREQ
jgi:uncharacterized protein (TIGR02117 family)